MTREEAIADIRDNIKPIVGGKSLDMAIKALEQQPCEDCVSRRAVYEILNDAYFLKIDDGAALQESVKQLPSVTPQQKMGKWKAFTHSAYRGNDEDGEPIWREVTVYHCDLCNRRTVIKEKYCPNCGRKMQEVEE